MMLFIMPPYGSQEYFTYVGAAFILLLLIMCCCCRRGCRRKPKVIKEYREVHTIERVSAPQRVVETKEKIIERVLVICPYCSHKNEQGVSTCGECGADV